VNRDKTALVEVDCNTGKELKNLFVTIPDITDAQYSRKKQQISFVIYETGKRKTLPG